MDGLDPELLIADLDPDQRVAVTTPSRLVAVVAGAGSGKTRVLTRRLAFRIAAETADARHTLALTFTREAAGELRRRLTRLGLRDHVEAGTFHSVMLAVLRQRWADTGRGERRIVNDRRRLVADAIGPRRAGLDDLVAEIGWATARGIDPDDYEHAARSAGRRPSGGLAAAAEGFASYRDLKRRRGVIDFDDVLSLTVTELERDRDFADALRWRFRHVLVDEAQDLNPVQHRLVDLLRAGRDDLFLVGDPAQAIYGFNGADPSLLVDVETRFPGIEVVRLPVNHRCTPEIVGAGVHVLRVSRQPAELVSARAEGPTVTVLTGDDEADEARRIAGHLVATDPTLVRAGEVAVLARTHAQLGPIAEALEMAGLPVRRSTAGGSPLQRAVQQAAGLTSASRLRAWAHDTLEAIERGDDDRSAELDDRPTGPADAAGADVGRASASLRHRRSREREEERRLVEAERRVAAAVLDYLRNQPRGDGAGFRSWVATTDPFADRESAGVELLTFHAAKGREWHQVYVTGTETSLVPHRTATTLAAKAEEARLLYVALTRATDRLVITHSARRGGYRRKPSPFLAELDVGPPEPVPPPRRRRERRPRSATTALRAWRAEAARRADVLPTQLCTDRDLAAIARTRPGTAEEIADVTSMGLLTARRLAPEILPLIAEDDDSGREDDGAGRDGGTG